MERHAEQIAMAAVQAQVRMVLMQQQLAKQRAAHAQERELKSMSRRRSAPRGAASAAQPSQQQQPGEVLGYNVKPIDSSAIGDVDADIDP